MRFQHYDLGYRDAGDIVVVSLEGNQANVRLMDDYNFANYRRSGQHSFVGGRATQSPVRFSVPRSARWHVAIDMQGLAGSVRTGINVLPGHALRPLPAIQERPLASMPSLVRNAPPAEEGASSQDRAYDVFISHASEDKDEVVRPLALTLRNAGLAVWYDEFELKIGDSLRRKIDRGLGRSRFGVVVLSPNFFGKGWTNYELDGLVTRANSGEQILLPVWHKVTKQEVMSYSASLADKLARSTTSHTVEDIASEIATVIREK